MELRVLRYFHTVVREGSITDAAVFCTAKLIKIIKPCFHQVKRHTSVGVPSNFLLLGILVIHSPLC